MPEQSNQQLAPLEECKDPRADDTVPSADDMELREPTTACLDNVPPKEAEEDVVSEASWESFPASDPPASNHFT
jgi:hypothetical protein